jgi:hypothetical protein
LTGTSRTLVGRNPWVPMSHTACHVGNQIFLRAFLNKMCYELMHGRAPRVSHFWAFGCWCFILKKGRLDKFESSSFDWIFLGYASHSRAFRVNRDTNLVLDTCEVTFDETQPCNSSVFECQVMMKLARRSLRMRSTMLERMMVKLQPCMYPLLPL